MQTTQQLRSEPFLYPPWMMLTVPTDPTEPSDAETEPEPEEIPLDLSLKMPLSSPSVPKVSTPSKGSKLSIAPLTEHDLLKHPTINTIELVQAIKDILSHYSISQRHFGEKVLGLSQGSVR